MELLTDLGHEMLAIVLCHFVGAVVFVELEYPLGKLLMESLIGIELLKDFFEVPAGDFAKLLVLPLKRSVVFPELIVSIPLIQNK